MAAQALTFTASGGKYQTSAITGGTGGKLVLHINFNNINSRIRVERSIDTSDGWGLIEDIPVCDCIFEKEYTGIYSDVSLRVVSEKQPNSAKYLAI